MKAYSQWTGTVKDEAARRAAPSAGYITSAAEFQQLWKAWMGKEPVPEIDFQLGLVVVGTSGSGYNVVLLPYLNKGDLKVWAWSELTGTAGFGYQILTLDRRDIRTINGKRIASK
jgi:hypothetical protein